MNMKLPAVRLRFTRVLTWWHRRRRAAMLGSRRTVVGYLQRSGRCPLDSMVLDPDTNVGMLGSPNAQKSRKPMMPWAELLNYILSLQEQLFFLTEYPDEPRAWCSSARSESVVRVLSWSQSPLTFERAANYHLYTVCSYMQLPSSKPSLMFLNL